ncbi:hypothetical protein HJG60_010711 [Phyllostomus discolor]|uniref:Uncharacterized protein n=1 Tax=Phyllostomus discolor TaxID=89673 RepID=A0A834ARX2_9CHIR|nr:hypothetical protein HJG60_010711 [Phyllostomus discolor]
MEGCRASCRRLMALCPLQGVGQGAAKLEAPSGDCGLWLCALPAPQAPSHTGVLAPGAALGPGRLCLRHSHSQEQRFPSRTSHPGSIWGSHNDWGTQLALLVGARHPGHPVVWGWGKAGLHLVQNLPRAVHHFELLSPPAPPAAHLQGSQPLPKAKCTRLLYVLWEPAKCLYGSILHCFVINCFPFISFYYS